MNEITKPNDVFAAVIQAPDVNVFDLAKSNIVPENTQLQSKEFYKASPIVQNMFTDEKGNFNILAFDNAYNKAASLYSELGKDEQLSQALEWDPYDYTAPIEGRHIDVRPIITKDFNPYKSIYSRTALNSMDSSALSLREIAQSGKVFDPKTNTWSEKSGNDLSLFNKFFGDTLIYAQYDKDTTEIDPLTQKTITHKKGDWKYDEDGNLYLEKLGNREIYGRQIVNPMDMLTTDGSVFNSMDFFDSDGKNKSMIGTTAKLIVEIAPFLIPGVQEFYGGYKMAMGLSYVLPTFYKALEGIFLGESNVGNESALWKAMNSTQGYLSKYNQNSVSDESSSSLFNYEQLTNLVSDVYSQIYEQRAAAKLSTIFYKQSEAQYLEPLRKSAEKQLSDLSIVDDVLGISRSKEGYEKIAQRAANKIQELSDVTKKRSALAKDLNLAYMAMTQSADVYGEALSGGYDVRTAGAAALLSAAGQFALMRNNPLGDWFLDKAVGYDDETAKLTKALNSHISSKYDEIEKGIKQIGTNKVVGKQMLGNTFKEIKSKIQNFIGEANTLKSLSGNIARNATIEGIEEVSEQAVVDMSKGVVDFLSYMGLTNKPGSFGGFDVVFSKSGFETYLANLVGGIVGGGLFEVERSIVSPILTTGALPPDIKYSLIDAISNGKTKDLLAVLEKKSSQFSSNTLSPIATEVDGKKMYLASQEGLTQAKFIYDNIKQYIIELDNILNSEDVKNDNESWVRKAIIDEVRIQDILAHNTDGFIISDTRELVDQLITTKSLITTAEANKEDTSKLTSKLKEINSKLEEIQTGKKSDYYFGLSQFSLNPNLHKMFMALSVEDYAELIEKKNFNELPKAEQEQLAAKFKAIMEDDTQFKNRMKFAYEKFMEFNELFSKPLEDYGKDGYNALRKLSFDNFYFLSKDLEDAIAEKNIPKLKQLWSNIHSFNSALASVGLGTTDLNSSIGLNFGKFMLESGVIKLGLSNKEMSNLLQISPEKLQVHLKAQAILTRLEKEGFDFSMSLSDFKSLLTDTENKVLIDEEIKLLFDTILSDYDLNQPISAIYKPQVFEDSNFLSLSNEEKEDLVNVLNRFFPLDGSLEFGVISQALHQVNNAQPTELVDLQNLLTTIDPEKVDVIDTINKQKGLTENRKNFRITTQEKFINTPAFIRKNLDKFYANFIDFFDDEDFEIVTKNEDGNLITTSVSEFIQGVATTNKNLVKVILENLSESEQLKMFNGEILTNEEKWNILKEKLDNSATKSEVGTFGDYAPYSDLLTTMLAAINALENIKTSDGTLDISKFNSSNILEKLLATLLSENKITTLDFTTFKLVLSEIFKQDFNILTHKELVPLTTELLRQSDTVNSNIIGEHQIFATNVAPYDEDRLFINPIAQTLADFGEDIMKKGEKLDYEILEAVKTELSKLVSSDKFDIQQHVKSLQNRLNKILDYGNTQKNTLLDKLREVQITVFNEGKLSKTIFELLKELNLEVSKNISPVSAKIDHNTLNLIEKGLTTLTMVNGIIAAMTATADIMDPTIPILPDQLYGYNANFNKSYKKNGENKELGILLSEDIMTLRKELTIIEGKLKHFKLLAENNLGSTIEEQGRIKTSFLDSLLKRISADANDPLSLLKIEHNGRYLLTVDELKAAEQYELETRTVYLEQIIRNNFLLMTNNGTSDVDVVLDKIFEPFKDEKYAFAEFTLLDNSDSLLTETMTKLEVKNWYMHLHSILAGSSIDFLKNYKKYLEKEVNLQENFRVPFFTQQLVMRQTYGYLTGPLGKKIMGHSVSFLAKNVEDLVTPLTPRDEDKEFILAIKSAKGLPIPFLFFIRGTGGTGKSDVLANWALWVLTNKDIQLLGNTLDVISLAPTEKTKIVLEKSVGRDLTNVAIKSSLVDEFIDSLFPTNTNWLDKLNAVKESSIKEGQIEYKAGTTGTLTPSGIYIAQNTAVITQETLEKLFVDFKNETPKIIIIDEASKINSLQYQILNYLAEKHNYYIIVLGDELQEGTTLGNATSSLENIYMPNSIKLKSTIRAENIHKNDNNIALEQFVQNVQNIDIFKTSEELRKVILKHSVVNNLLNGDKFVDKLTINDLNTLDLKKEIVFVTETGTLKPEELETIQLAYGKDFKPKVLTSDLQGQEFDQVVILSKLEDKTQTSGEKVNINTAKKIYTALTRAKVATLIVGQATFITSLFTPETLFITSPKSLDLKESKKFLVTRNEEIEKTLQLLSSLDLSKVEEPKTKEEIVSEPESESPILTSEIEEEKLEEWSKTTDVTSEEIDLPLEKEEVDEVEEVAQLEKEDKKDEEINKTYIAEASPTKTLDLKVLSYPFVYNFGKELPKNYSEDFKDESAIRTWLQELSSLQDSTDFAAWSLQNMFVFDNSDDLVTTFNERLKFFIFKRNEILSKISTRSSAENASPVLSILDLENQERQINLATEPYILATTNYSQPYKVLVNSKNINGEQLFLMINVNGVPITLMGLADEKTATDPKKNELGKDSISELRTLYTNFRSNKKTPINLIGSLIPISGVQTIIDPSKKLEESPLFKDVENRYPGSKVIKYGAFRGPRYMDDGKLDPISVQSFITELELELNKNSFSKITVVDRGKYTAAEWEKRDKGIVAYQTYNFRPYLVLSFAVEGVNYSKIVLLYSKSRPANVLLSELDQLDTNIKKLITTKESTITIGDKTFLKEDLLKTFQLKKNISISKYQGWQLIEEFLISKSKLADKSIDDYIHWLWDVFSLRSTLSSDIVMNETLATLFARELLLWDKNKENLADFISKSKILQKIFKGITKGFNPIFYLHSYSEHIEADSDPIYQEFKDFMNNSDMKIFYRLNIGSLHIDSAYGEAFGTFDESLLENYFMAYHVQLPRFLLDLDPSKQKSTPVINVEKPVEEAVTISTTPTSTFPANQFLLTLKTSEILNGATSSELFTIDLTKMTGVEKIIAALSNSYASENRKNLLSKVNLFVLHYINNYYGSGIKNIDDLNNAINEVITETETYSNGVLIPGKTFPIQISDLQNSVEKQLQSFNITVDVNGLIESSSRETSICKII